MKAKGWKFGTGIVALVVAISACGASVPSTHVGAPGQGQKPAANAAPVKPVSLDDVSQAMSGDQDARVHLTVAFGAGSPSNQVADMTFASDATHDRFSVASKPISIPSDALPKGAKFTGGVGDVPGFEPRGQTGTAQTDLYLRPDGDKTWTHLVVDPSLADEVASFRDPSKSAGDALGAGSLSDVPGLTFENKGTVTYEGETMTRQVATLDFSKMLDDFAPSSTAPDDPADPSAGLKGALGDALASGGFSDLLPRGTIEVLVDNDQAVRRFSQDLTMGSKTDAMAMHVEATIDPLGTGDAVELPSADQVGRTVQVHTAAELAKALGDLGPLASGGTGGN